MAMRTIILKLHKPSSIKRKIIEEALIDYNAAYRYLLLKAYHEIDDIRENCKGTAGKYGALNIARWIDKDTRKELSKYGIEPFKDSLELDFGMTLAGYLNLERKQSLINYPLFKEFSKEKGCSEDSAEYVRNSENSLMLRPLYFCRYSINRDFCLLYDNENERYYAKLYLMNNKNMNKRSMMPSDERRTVYIHKSGKDLELSSRKVRFIIVPLSFGKWQEEYLKMGLVNPGIFKTARLVKKGTDYYLSVNLDIEVPAKIETTSFMGVGRGLKNSINYSISDAKGEASKTGFIEMPEVKKNVKNSFSHGELHKIANFIVDEAERNKAWVIVEQLVNKGDRLQWVDEKGKLYAPVLGCHDYNLIVKLLEYKLPAKGLPEPVKVSATEIFSTCPQCGMNTKRNRTSHDMFICTACGKISDIENLGSLNLSRRLIDNGNKAIKIKAERTPSGVKLINSDLGLECVISSPQEINGMLAAEINRTVKEFYDNIQIESTSKNFNKKYSLIKRLQQCEDVLEMVRVTN